MKTSTVMKIAYLEAKVAKLETLLSIAGVALPPPDWDGGVQIKGCFEEQTPDGTIVLWANEETCRDPEFWGVYYRESEGTHMHFCDFARLDWAQNAAAALKQLYLSDEQKEHHAIPH